MNNIKTRFSIKDLENLTGIKAHTIRIWEKRYNLLQPERTDTNIRYYNLENFQKLLNISYLNNNGYKISNIAAINVHKISSLVTELATQSNIENHAINTFKLAMLSFDQAQFYKTYQSLLKEKTFNTIFYTIFIPLLSEVGLLWQTNTITPAHERFLFSLIRQKLLINTEKVQSKQINTSKKTFVLYLPENEIHELGLMFINYQLINKGYQSIFLGHSIPLDNLKDIQNYYDEIIYVSYFTVMPKKGFVEKYINDFSKSLLHKTNAKLWILGQMLSTIELKKLPKGISAFKSIKALMNNL